MGFNRTGFSDNLSAFDVRFVDTTKKCADVVACLRFVQGLTEHFKTGDNRRLRLFGKPDDFGGIVDLRYASFNSARSNRATTTDRENVFDREKEGLLIVSFGSRNIAVNSVHKFENAFAFGSVLDFVRGVISLRIFKRFKSRALDDGRLIAGEAVFVQQISDFHFDEFL